MTASSENSLSRWICKQLAAFAYVFKHVLPAIIRTGKKPVIFDKYSGLGDIICTFPAAHELKKRHAGSPFIYNCHPDYACLPRLGGVTDRVTTLKDIGPVGYWYRFLLAGFYNFSSDDDNPQATPSQVYIRDFAQRHGVTVDDNHPILSVNAQVRSKMQTLLESRGVNPARMIVIHPGPSWTVREWPHDSWTGLIRELHQHGYGDIVQLGIAKVLRFGEVPLTPVPGATSLVGELSLEESVAVISMASLFIGIDSGLLHIAASVRVPSVGLWGATSAHLRFSSENRRSHVTGAVECRGCQHRFPRLHWFTGCPHDIACMKSISVEEVLHACLSRLEEKV